MSQVERSGTNFRLGKIRNNLIDDKSEDIKKCDIKRKFKFEDYKNCLEVTQLENKTNHLEKIKLMQIVLKKFIKNL